MLYSYDRRWLGILILSLIFNLGVFDLGSNSLAWAKDRHIIVQSTTSTQNSGLYEYILPAFTRQSGIAVHVVAVGTGQAIKNSRNCDGDVLLVHSKADELAFVASGYGLKRFDVMYNDFVIVGPKNDPAHIADTQTPVEAFQNIAKSGALFLSRGDQSGTHKAEMRIWNIAGLDPIPDSGKWYLESGQGMGGTLNLAVQLDSYVLSDRGTWLSFGAKEDHRILFSGSSLLFNQYGVIAVNPAYCPSVNLADAQIFMNWLLSDDAKALIASFTYDGQQLFFTDTQ